MNGALNIVHGLFLDRRFWRPFNRREHRGCNYSGCTIILTGMVMTLPSLSMYTSVKKLLFEAI